MRWSLPFLRRDEADIQPAMAAALPAASSPKLMVVAGSGSEVKRSVITYTDSNLIPKHKGVLTADGNLAVKEAHRQSVAALNLSSEALLLATEDFRGSDDYRTLKQRLEAAFPTVREAFATPSVLLGLYTGRTNRVERRDGEEALSIQLFRRIVDDAIKLRCNDIHIVLMDESEGAVVLYRIDGVVHRSERIPMEHALPAVSVAYAKLAQNRSSSDPTFIREQYQTASIPHPDIASPLYKLRYQSIPLAGGFKVALRTLQTSYSKNAEAKSLSELGYSPDQEICLYGAARRAKGMVLVAGGTGSGKTTLLKTLMTSSPTRHKRIQYSIENPVEYKMFGVSQIDVSGSASDDTNKLMLNAVHAVLRGDPDEVMVGEIREPQMASACKTMVQSGHLVMSTVHASSASEIPSRICSPEIGIPRDVLGGRNFVNAFVYQALVATLCAHCKIPAHKATEEQFPRALQETLREKFALEPSTMFVTNPAGCSHCNQGTSGQTAIAEVIRPDQTMRKLWQDSKDSVAEEYWRTSRTASFDELDCTGKTYIEHGLYKASIGLIDPVTIDAIEPLEGYEVFALKGQAE
jgi:type II secretory ATPase GspE/PulE/Tfp pilus assembly ATPase PilB-like protein